MRRVAEWIERARVALLDGLVAMLGGHGGVMNASIGIERPAPSHFGSFAIRDRSLREQAAAWQAVCDTLDDVTPGWSNRSRRAWRRADGPGSDEELACRAIRRLRAQYEQACDMESSWFAELELLRQALGVPDEPHHTVSDRTMDRVRGLRGGQAVVPEWLIDVARRLDADRRDNDHHTADPIFTVQREDRVYGVGEDWAEGFIWTLDGERCGDELATRLERRHQRGWDLPERFSRIGYVTRWEFVDAYLTPEGAGERVEYENRKHSGRVRVYVESGCRNVEWKALRAHLLALADAHRAQHPQRRRTDRAPEVSNA